MSTTIDRDSFNRARSLLNEGRVSEAWQVLGDAGDNYARNAAIITGDDDSQRGKILVRETWENTVGEDIV